MTGPDDSRGDLAARLVDEVPGLLRYARSLTRDAQQAEDLVQDTVVRALERSGSFDGRSSLATWLHRILHNLAVDAGRRRSEVPDDLLEAAAEQVDALWSDDRYSVDSAVVVENAQLREQLQDALLRLPLIYRSAVVLHDVEGLTVADVATIAHIGLPAAKQRLRRGRMMLVTDLSSPPGHQHGQEFPMRCWDARSQVSEYLDDDLSMRERGLLEQHLQGCPTCPPLYAGLVGVQEALGRHRDPDDVVPPGLATRIRELCD